MTEIMRLEICDSLQRRSITEIRSLIATLFIEVSNIVPQNFGKNLHQNIEKSEMSLYRLEKDFRLNKSSPINQDAEVPTYDVINSGPRHQFMIMTNNGPLIVHNCVYQMGGGGWGKKGHDTIKTGLWGYAENMNVEMSQDQAKQTVDIFRQSYREIPDFWHKAEKAIADVLKEGTVRVKRELGPNGCIKIDKITIRDRYPLLRIQLPSGRYLHYFEARIESVKMPWQDEAGDDVYRDALVYMGQDQTTRQWVPITSRGGKVLEQLCQGISRDVLGHDIIQAEENDLPVLGHAHDEIIAERKKDVFAPGIFELQKIMSSDIFWAPNLLLGAEGFETPFYRKN